MKRCLYTFNICIMGALVLLASCTHKELCYHHPHTAAVQINVDWSEFKPLENPTGMTLKLYPANITIDDNTHNEMNSPSTTVSSDGVVTHLTNTTSHAILNLPLNSYHVLVFNQSTTEFGSFTFRDMDDKESAVVAMQYSSHYYRTQNGESKVATSPEWLGVGNYADARVTQAMIDAETQSIITGTPINVKPVIAEVTPHNVIYTVKVRIHINNIYNLRSARASMTGMAEGFQLTSEQRLTSEVTHLLEQWSMTQDETDPTKGYVESSFTCFGLPGDHAARVEENTLTFEALLVDNKTVESFPFNVGDRFVLDESDPTGMTYTIVIPGPITLSDVEPDGGSSSGFDVTVDDWGDEIEHEIQM